MDPYWYNRVQVRLSPVVGLQCSSNSYHSQTNASFLLSEDWDGAAAGVVLGVLGSGVELEIDWVGALGGELATLGSVDVGNLESWVVSSWVGGEAMLLSVGVDSGNVLILEWSTRWGFCPGNVKRGIGFFAFSQRKKRTIDTSQRRVTWQHGGGDAYRLHSSEIDCNWNLHQRRIWYNGRSFLRN